MKLVMIADTHDNHEALNGKMPEGDVLIVAGDFTMQGMKAECQRFNEWLGKQPYKHKLVIPGNHELTFDEKKRPHDYLEYRALITNGTLLINQDCIIDGVRFYGIPQTPEFYDWAFNEPRGPHGMGKFVNAIPRDTDVLITHGPPYGILDIAKERVYNDILKRYILVDMNKGCEATREMVDEIKPKIHVFGHFHGPYGTFENLVTKFFNAAICDEKYRPLRTPLTVEI